MPSVGWMGTPSSIFTGSMQSMVFSLPQKQIIEAAKLSVRSAEANLKDARETVALDASTNYIELDTVTRQLEAARTQEDHANRLVQIVQQRAEAGIDPQMDYLQARLTAAELHLARIHLESRIGTLKAALATLTGLPAGSIVPEHASIPEIPKLNGQTPRTILNGIEAARLQAEARQKMARADELYVMLPQITFNAQYSRYTTLANNADSYFARPLKSDNFSSGFQIQIPLFDIGHRFKIKQSSSEVLKARIEYEQAQRQNDEAITTLDGTLRELDARAEIASLKQQIATQQIAIVQSQLENGNGAGAGSTPQLSPKAEQQAHIDERQKFLEVLDAELELAKTRLNLVRTLGHMQDWLNELHRK